MNVVLALSNHPQRVRIIARTFLAAFAGTLALFSSGCYGPAMGPTDPKDFIVQGKQWTSTTSSPVSNRPTDATAPVTTP
jgi:hypothetical protein